MRISSQQPARRQHLDHDSANGFDSLPWRTSPRDRTKAGHVAMTGASLPPTARPRDHIDGLESAHSHQRKSFCVKPLVGALPVVCPCIAVMGLGPTACNRVGQTTGGAAHDERRGYRGSSMPRGARPGRQLEGRRSGGWLDHLTSAAGGDRRIPFLACGHDREQLAQQRGS